MKIIKNLPNLKKQMRYLKKFESMDKKLIVNKKTILEVDYSDFEEFVNSIYGGNLEITAIQEMGNDSFIEQTVPSKYRYPDKKKEEQIRNGKYPMYSIGYIFDCLYEDGYLGKGNYLIKISW